MRQDDRLKKMVLDPATGLKFKPLWQTMGWAMVGIVVWFSLVPQLPQLPNILGLDKIQHILAYFVLMYWYGMGFTRHWRWSAFFVLLGIGLEFLQGYGGFRSFDLYDMVANTFGVILGQLILQTPARRLLAIVDRFFAVIIDRSLRR